MAGFIGSPAMNFLPGTLEDGHLHTALGEVVLPAEVRGKVLEAGAGRDLIVGIRPGNVEDAALVDGKLGGGAHLPGGRRTAGVAGVRQVRLLPAHGARATAQELEELAADAGTTDAPGGTDQVVARLDPASRAREGRPLELWFNPGNGAHLTL